MNSRILHLITRGLVLCALLLTACAPEATPTGPSQADQISTRAAELASMMLTATVAAYSPTPAPSNTPVPTATATIEPTPAVVRPLTVKNGPASCYLKPDITAALSSNITDKEPVEMLAIGATVGWYKINNPYFHTPCWILGEHLDIDPNMDLSGFPIE